MTENNQSFGFPQIFKLPSIACLSKRPIYKKKSSSSTYHYLRPLISQQIKYNKSVADGTECSPSYNNLGRTQQIENTMNSCHKYRQLMKMIRSKPMNSKYSEVKPTKNESSLEKKQLSFDQFNKYKIWSTISVNKMVTLDDEKIQDSYEPSSQILKNIKINRSKTQMDDPRYQQTQELRSNIPILKKIKIKFPRASLLKSALDKVSDEENCSIRHSLQPSKSRNEEMNQRSNFRKRTDILKKRVRINLNFRNFNSENQSKLNSPCQRLSTQIAGWTVSEFKD